MCGLYDTPTTALWRRLEVNTLLTDACATSRRSPRRSRTIQTRYLPNNNQYNGTAYIGTTTFDTSSRDVSLFATAPLRASRQADPVQSYMLWALAADGLRSLIRCFSESQSWTIGVAYAGSGGPTMRRIPTVDPTPCAISSTAS